MIDIKDPYEGEIDHTTQLRHGKGVARYRNPYFQYQGDFDQGVKHGHGIMYFRDGGSYEGEFDNGEITGKGVRKWPEGTVYTGGFLDGEKHGQGTLELPSGETYEGEWNCNLREGRGAWKLANGTKYTGEFRNHHPNGNCDVIYSNGDRYSGEVQKSAKHGEGVHQSFEQRTTYTGSWESDKRVGQGKIEYLGGFTYEGKWVDDNPEYTPNQLIIPNLETLSGELQGEDGPDIYFEFGKDPVSFEIHTVFQGEDYEDPDGPTPEELAKMEEEAKKKKKKGEEEEIGPKMITPDPVLLEGESGRELTLSIHKEVTKVDEETQEESTETVQGNLNLSDPDSESKELVITSQGGVFKIENLAFPEEYDFGKFTLTFKDTTRKAPQHLEMPTLQFWIAPEGGFVPEDKKKKAGGKKK